jgi:type IV fimbrial biogenesis protein FimT
MRIVCRQDGFTLVEILVAMSIGFIAAGIAVPTMTTYVKQYRLMGAATNIGAEVNRARLQAISQTKYVRVGLAGNKVCRMTSDDGATFAPASCASASEYYELPTGVSATVTNYPTFASNGISDSITNISVSSDAGTRTIRANVLGRVSIS